MRKKGHLSLVETPIKSAKLESNEYSFAKARPAKGRQAVQQRLDDAEEELSTVRDITGAALFLMRSLPLESLKLQELHEMHDMFLNASNLLNVYDLELTQLANGGLSAKETRQYAKVRNIFKQLRSSLPEAAKLLAGIILKAEPKQAKKVSSKPAAKTTKAGVPKGVQLKVTIKDSAPPIWRRIQVPGDCTLGELHYTIQQSMGWQNCHLHRFCIRGSNYSDEPDDLQEDEYTLQNFVFRKGNKFEYVYDFGDWWVHTIEIEKTLDAPHDVLECIDGRLACPPEDSGGIFGYYQKLQILKNPMHPEYEETREWMGDDFDPEGM